MYFFFDFRKNSIRFERNFVQSFYLIYWSFVCNFIKFVLLGCEKQPKLTQNGQKTTIFRLFLIFAKTVHTIGTKISTVILYTTICSMCAISINLYNGLELVRRKKSTPLPYIRLWFFPSQLVVGSNLSFAILFFATSVSRKLSGCLAGVL